MADEKRKIINPYNHVRIIDVYGPLPRFMGLVHIGTLAKINSLYTFDYVLNDNAMVSRPLVNLSAVHNETDNIKNWYFFSKRIPPLHRSDVREAVERDGIDASRPMTLLAVFGAQIIQEPRILVSRL